MMHNKSDSDVTSLAPSSPSGLLRGRPTTQIIVHACTPVYNSPMESPSHPSYGRHSRASSASRFSGAFRSSSGRKANRKRNDKGWPECNVIQEEGAYDDLDDDKGLSRRCQIILAFISFVLLFTVFCLIIWGASRPYKADVIVKSIAVDDLYAGEGSDSTGVPTKMITVNCSLKINVYNPAPTFGIHVTSSSINLIYSQIAVASGQLKKYYQPRKSHRTISVILQGEKVLSTAREVPLTLDFEIRSRGYVVGKLVRVTHRRRISCRFTADSSKTKPIIFAKNACTYS
ncbi:unnamed protein product [Spirodela intermedia]|uniref:Late embryogenesis abundant protein LEA-2 subgroup domain-containing protein n=1 Tax=Spirodela intermedia TaxID=51605 RepID=A0A7I8J7D3_SPIIN|nr:unnamed protein product [Spirodela intermedia]CAA6665981.1 unnamed protein product [Spirodela intermedia]